MSEDEVCRLKTEALGALTACEGPGAIVVASTYAWKKWLWVLVVEGSLF